jgi:hypothetical protein
MVLNGETLDEFEDSNDQKYTEHWTNREYEIVLDKGDTLTSTQQFWISGMELENE